MRKQIAAANWKMNLHAEEAFNLLDDIYSKSIELSYNQIVVLSLPYIYIAEAIKKYKVKNNYFIAAQNCAATTNGAFTGEISASMLSSLGVKFIIIGHSERREFYFESNQILIQKIDRCLENNITPIFCCGEKIEIRDKGEQNEFVANQIIDCLFHLSQEQIKHIVIAYEPIWAIGTGKTASSQEAEDMHKHIRKILAQKFGDDTANQISILYGGSVKSNNATEIFSQDDVDGGLIGGASLNAFEFSGIINALKK